MDFAVPAVAPTQIKIITFNVAGFNAILKKGFQSYVASEKPDILCLQETKVAEDKVPKDVLPGYESYFYACREPGRHGTAVFTRIKPILVKKGLGIEKLDHEGRLITVEYDGFYVLCCYVPNSSTGFAHWPLRKEWDAAFLAYVKKLDAKKPIVWCGDLNVSHLWIDLANPKSNCNKTPGFLYGERDNMSKLLAEGFVDVYRSFHPKRKAFWTFWTYKGGARAKDIGWRLDYFITSARLIPAIKHIWRRPKIMGSDHCPLGIVLELPK